MKTRLGGLFYPTKDSQGNDVPWESLFIPWIYKEIYFECLYEDITNGKKDMTIIDVGSNIGVTVQYFRQFAKKVYAIEPSPEHFEALSKNKAFNNWDNVELTNVAIADKKGKMEFNINTINRTCNSLVLSQWSGYQAKTQVDTLPMDEFFKINNIKKCDFMKFDVEGAEDLIIRSEGFKKVAKKIDAIMIEFHFPSWPQLVEYICSLGYEARRYQSSAVVILFVRIK